MFYFSHMLLIGPNLDPLMFSVSGGEALLAVGSVWVEDSDIKIGPLVACTPETTGSDVQLGTILHYSRGTSEGFTRDWL